MLFPVLLRSVYFRLMRMRPLLAPAFGLCLLLASGGLLAQSAPGFSLPGNDGQTVSLDQLRGKIVYLDFWASWCTPCRKSFPWMNAMQARYGSDKFAVVAINLDASRDEARAFLKKIPAEFTVAFDPEGTVASQYHLQAMPSSYLIGPDGELVYAHKGFRENATDEIEARIRKLLHGQ